MAASSRIAPLKNLRVKALKVDQEADGLQSTFVSLFVFLLNPYSIPAIKKMRRIQAGRRIVVGRLLH